MKHRLSPPRTAAAAAIAVCAGAIAMCAGPSMASPARGKARARAWTEYVPAPAQFDLSLAEITFGAPAHVARTAAGRPQGSPIRLEVRGATGLDYVAGALLRAGAAGRPRALVLVINRRPRGSLVPDLARIKLLVSAARRQRAPLVSRSLDPFTRPRALMPALCDVPARGVSLAGADLRALLRRGPALAGFSAAAAIAQAYDVVCHRPYDPAFRQAVTRGAAACEGARVGPVLCCPPNALCLPPPCPPCPCGPGPCPLAAVRGRTAAIACPLQAIPVVCPLLSQAAPQMPGAWH